MRTVGTVRKLVTQWEQGEQCNIGKTSLRTILVKIVITPTAYDTYIYTRVIIHGKDYSYYTLEGLSNVLVYIHSIMLL